MANLWKYNENKKLFLFSRKNPVSLPKVKQRGARRAEIIPYEPDTVSTGEGIVSEEHSCISPYHPFQY